jgi:hypothetical protein
MLHLEKMRNDKIIICILRYGFNQFIGSSSKSDASAHTFISGMQHVIQRQVLGTNECPSQWKLKWSKTGDGMVIVNVQVRNQTARKIVNHIDIIIEEFMADEDIRSKLIITLQHYAHAMELLLLHSNL